MTDLISIVQKLRASGLCVIPSGGGKDGKHPLVKWKQYQEHLPTEEEYQEWFKQGISLWGVVTGKISDVVVVDVDPGADPSIMGDLKPHVRTPRGGGHYYFKYPGHHVKTQVGILPKIDIRGDGGFANIIGTNPKAEKGKGEYRIERMPCQN